MRNLFLGFAILVFSSFLLFYFWASSGFNHSLTNNQIVTFAKQEKIESDTFSICTYNIGYLSGMTNNLPVHRSETLFSKNLTRTRQLFATHNFDFICLQEVDFESARSFNYNQFDSIGRYLNYHHAAYAINWDKSYIPFPYFPLRNHFGKMLSGQGVLSKRQIMSNDLTVLDKPFNAPFYYNAFYLDRLLQVSKVQLGSDTLIIMNLHLEAFDRETREQQAKKVLSVFDSFASQYPVVLLGDFNSRPPFASEIVEPENTITMFLNNPLIDEAIPKERYLQNESRFFTYNSIDPHERLDYIFYNNNKIRKIDADVLIEAGDISDHLPVWFKFVLAN